MHISNNWARWPFPSSFRWILFTCVVEIAGCATYPKPSDFVSCAFHATPIAPPSPSGTTVTTNAGSNAAALVRTLTDCSMQVRGKFKAIVISGGGADGAYGSGFLSYMIQDKTSLNPLLGACLVTGVSTGAVMAPYIFLATSPERDPAIDLIALRDMYLQLDDDTLVARRPFLALPLSSSIYDVSGIRRVIEQTVTDDFLAAIAQEKRKHGRQLIVGATDIYTGIFEAINLTDIADDSSLGSVQRKKCFGEAVRASAAIPVLFPPVAIADVVENTTTETLCGRGCSTLGFSVRGPLNENRAWSKRSPIWGYQ